MTLFSRIIDRLWGKEAGQMDLSPLIDRDVFVEDKHPDELLPKKTEGPKSTRFILDLLQEVQQIDYEALGEKDGYEKQDVSRMKVGEDLVIAAFRKQYAYAIEYIEKELQSLRPQLTDELLEVMPVIYGELHELMKSLEDQLAKMALERDLALSGDGIVELAVMRYRAGFEKGYRLFIKEKMMYGSTFKLFEL
jgi:hypothetical protein